MKNRLFTGGLRQRFAAICLLGLLSVTLTGCQNFSSDLFPDLYQEEFPESTGWAVLPFISQIGVPAEDLVQLERILLVQLPSVGIKEPKIFRAPDFSSAPPDYLADIIDVERGRVWAITEQIDYSISGEIFEWQYDEQNRFSTILSLKVMDVSTNKVVWSIDGMGEGRTGESAYDVCRKLLVDLLSAMPVHSAQ